MNQKASTVAFVEILKLSLNIILSMCSMRMLWFCPGAK